MLVECFIPIKITYFVKWKGFNDTYNSWIDFTDIAQQFKLFLPQSLKSLLLTN